jgi:glutamate carboxypeptidase
MKQLLTFCESERGWLRQTIERLVLLESPTPDAPAVDRCASDLARRLAAIGGRVRDRASRGNGNHLVAEFGSGRRRVLLLGHFDTVWPVGTLGGMPLVERDGRLFGPGVLDMKGGIGIAMLALRALVTAAQGVMPHVVLLLTADEETGSPTSRPLIEDEARKSDAVLVLEPALPSGALKTSRKGCGQFEIAVTGLAAHAGIEPERGANAILELCDQIRRVERLQDLERGTSLTVCLASGGSRANVVPADARATIDARAFEMAEAARVTDRLLRLRAKRPGTAVHVSGGFDRPPLERGPSVVRLFELAESVGRRLGIAVTEGATGGGSDGNFTAALGVPTLDGLGAIGDGAHAAHEHVVLDHLAPRAALVAGLVQAIGLAEQPDMGY